MIKLISEISLADIRSAYMRKDNLNMLNDLFNGEIEKKRLAGATVRVYHKNEMIFSNAYGSDCEDSIYKIYSMSKPITSVALMILYERGLIDLFDPVGKYIPAYSNMKVIENGVLRDAKREITLKDVMNMTSGLVYPGTDNEPSKIMDDLYADLHKRALGGEKMTNLSILTELASVPLLFDPGDAWYYGISADVVGGVVEVVSGMPYGEFLKKEIFDPLGMNDTGFFVPEEKINRLAKMYARENEVGDIRLATEKELEWLNEYAPTKKPFIESAGGGLYSTLDDYSKFALMMVNGGEYNGVRILGRKTVEFIGSNQLDDAQHAVMKKGQIGGVQGYGYGNLNRVLVDKTDALSNGSIGEYGWDGLPGTYFCIDPKEQLVIVYMQQIKQGGDYTLRRKMRQIIYGAI